MKTIATLLIFLSFPLFSYSNNWVKSLGDSEGTTRIVSIISDSNEDIIIAGTYSSEKLQLSESLSITNQGVVDVFLVKYDTLGNIRWHLSFGGQKSDIVNDICLDEEDNIYLTGVFTSATLTIDENQVSSSWPQNVYVAKFSSNGEYQWLKHSTELSYYTKASSIDYTSDGRIVLGGSTNGTSLSFGEFKLTSETGYSKGYYCELNTSGEFTSAKMIEGVEDEQYWIYSVVGDGDGNVYTGGMKTIETEFDSLLWTNYKQVLYLGKYSSSGAEEWEKLDTLFQRVEKLILVHDSLLILGSKEDYRIIFNGGTIDTTSQIVLGTMNRSGEELWKKSFTGGLAYDMVERGNRIIFTGGILKDELNLGVYSIHRNADSSSICPIYQDIFLAELDKSGTVLAAGVISGSLEDLPTSVHISDEGHLYYSGTFESFRLAPEGKSVYNPSSLSVFHHVSGTYYDRAAYTFIARRPNYAGPVGNPLSTTDLIFAYPNPASDYIELDSSFARGDSKITFFTLDGRIKKQFMLTDGEGILNVSSIPTGTYLLQLENSQSKRYSQIMIIQR